MIGLESDKKSLYNFTYLQVKINFEKSNDLLSSLKADNDTIYMKVKLTFAYFLKNRQISFSFLACLLKNHKKK